MHIAWGGIILFGIGISLALQNFASLLPPCIFKTMTGIPCLTCGGTRCVLSIGHLDIAGSFLSNPLIFLTLAGLVIFSILVLTGLAFKRRLEINLLPKEKIVLRYAVIGLIAVNWAFLIIQAR